MTILFPNLGGTSQGGGGGGSTIDIEGSPLIGVVTSGGTTTISSLTYVHDQDVAASTWEITHNLNKYPTVILVDNTGTTFRAPVTYDSLSKCTVTLNVPAAGKAYLN